MILFHHFLNNAFAVFRGRNLLWITVAVILTLTSVYSGFDWGYFVVLKDSSLYHIFLPAIAIGALVPICIPLIVVAIGSMRKHPFTIETGWMLGQAAILGSLISSLLKAFTGRIPPPMELVSGFVDSSRGFQLGFLEGGIFWGWPSSHTTIAFAMAVALALRYRKDIHIVYGALIYAFYIGIGISMSIHWFSEFIAGIVVGTVIGVIVGKSFMNISRTVQR